MQILTCEDFCDVREICALTYCLCFVFRDLFRVFNAYCYYYRMYSVFIAMCKFFTFTRVMFYSKNTFLFTIVFNSRHSFSVLVLNNYVIEAMAY